MKNIKASKLKEKELNANYVALVSGGRGGTHFPVLPPKPPKPPKPPEDKDDQPC